jgi:group I intron endonuclease
MTEAGVYAITSMTSLQTYIGSTVNVPARWRHHRTKFRNGTHPCESLQDAWTRDGEPFMLFTVLEYTPAAATTRIRREQWWIDHTPDVMNDHRRAAASGPPLGYKQSSEQGRKISAALTGRKRTPEQIARHANAIRGKKNPAVSRAMKGKPWSAARRAAYARSRSGE